METGYYSENNIKINKEISYNGGAFWVSATNYHLISDQVPETKIRSILF